MHKSWRFIPSFKTIAVIIGAFAALVLSGSSLLAQGELADDGSGPGRKYMFMASGTWGAAQDAAIRGAGGTVDFSHAASGIGSASSSDPGFLRRAMKGGAFAKGAEDMQVQWQEPANEQALDAALTEEAVTPGDDAFINLLWNMTAIEAGGAWSLGYDGAGVRVAVIDGGICTTHPDLAANIDAAASRSFVTGFGYGDDTGGPTAFRHACHVAGIIAAVDNTIGTIGVAPRATIIACKALHGGSGSFAAVIQAILYASDPIPAGGGGAHIINMSLGATLAMGGGNTGAGALVAAMNQAVNHATSNNVLVVCSAGGNAADLDHSGSLMHVPSQSGGALAVSATAPVGFAVGWPNGAANFRDPTTYTNYGRSAIWVSAPGGDSALPGNAICSIPPVTTFCWVFDLVLSPGSAGGGYSFAGGTSMSAPHAAGVAALIAQKYPGISVGDLKNRLKNTADDEGAAGIDPFHGHGFVNARRAVTEGAAAQATASPGRKQETAAAPPAAAARVELAIGRNGSDSVPSISFTLAAPGHARVELFDVAGRKVAVLFDGPARQEETLKWNGRGPDGRQLRQGAYFARLKAGGVTTARQLVMLGE